MSLMRSLGFVGSPIKVTLYDLKVGDQIEVLRDTPHLAQVYSGEVCTVTRISEKTLFYKDRRGYIWSFYLSADNLTPLNESFVRHIPKPTYRELHECESIRVYDSCLVGGNTVCKQFKVLDDVVIAYVVAHDLVKPKSREGLVQINVNKRQCAKLKKKEKKNV